MGLVLLWSTSLAASLILVALAAALSARRRGLLGRIRSPVCVALLLPFLFGTAAIFLVGVMLAEGARFSLLGYSLSWTIAFLAGTAALIALAVRRCGRGDEPERALGWSRRRLAAASGVATVVYIGALLYVDMRARLHAARVRLEAGRIALSAAPPRVPDEKNAALVYQRAFDRIEATEGRRITAKWLHTSYSPLNRVLQPDFDATVDEARQLLREQERTLVLLRRASAMPEMYLEADYARPLVRRQVTFSEWRRFANLLALSARSRAENGDIEAAMEDTAAIWRMAAHMSSCPFLASQFIAAILVQKGARTLENCLAAAPVRKKVSGTFCAKHPKGRPGKRFLTPFSVHLRDAYLRALRMEEAYRLARVSTSPAAFLVSRTATMGKAYRLRRAAPVSAARAEPDLPAAPGPWEEEGGPSGPAVPSPFSFGTVWRLFLFPHDLAACRRWTARERSLAATPYFAQTAQTVPDAVLAPSLSGSRRSSRLLNRRVAEAEAIHRLALVALGVTRYRSRHGRYPDELAELVPDHIEKVPRDPFDGKPVRMLPADGGVVLYSVSRDGLDDGGAEHAKTMSRAIHVSGPPGRRFLTRLPRAADITFCLGEAYRVRRLRGRRARP